MALETNLITFCPKPRAMRIMTIAACHPFMKHSALHERTILVDFALDLTVREVEFGIKQRHSIVIFYWLAVYVVLVNLTATRVTSSAHLKLVVCLSRLTATRIL
jgi:hypothetical protein